MDGTLISHHDLLHKFETILCVLQIDGALSQAIVHEAAVRVEGRWNAIPGIVYAI